MSQKDPLKDCVEVLGEEVCEGDVVEIGVHRKIVRGKVVRIGEYNTLIIESNGRRTAVRISKISYIARL